MGNCKYCGESAGLLRSAHENCEKAYSTGRARIESTIHSAIATGAVPSDMAATITAIADSARISANELREVMIAGTETAIDAIVADGLLSETEEKAFDEVTTQLGISVDAIPQHLTNKLVMAVTLRDILEGQMPQCRISVDGALPFVLQKSESLVWVENSVTLSEETSRTQYQGGSQGASMRVAKGLYFRVGSTKGEFSQIASIEQKDIGLLGITTKHIYYSGNRNSFRIPYAKIVSCNAYSDAISVTVDGARAKPRIFGTSNPWFFYNAIMNLSRMDD